MCNLSDVLCHFFLFCTQYFISYIRTHCLKYKSFYLMKCKISLLHPLYANLEKLKHNGDNFAAEFQNRLRIIVAGEDGTTSWLLGVVSSLKLPHPLPVAIVLVGTRNSLSFAFG